MKKNVNGVEVELTKDDASDVLGSLVTVDGMKIGRVKKYDNGRWGFSSNVRGVRGFGAIDRTQTLALEALVSIVRLRLEEAAEAFADAEPVPALVADSHGVTIDGETFRTDAPPAKAVMDRIFTAMAGGGVPWWDREGAAEGTSEEVSEDEVAAGIEAAEMEADVRATALWAVGAVIDAYPGAGAFGGVRVEMLEWTTLWDVEPPADVVVWELFGSDGEQYMMNLVTDEDGTSVVARKEDGTLYFWM